MLTPRRFPAPWSARELQQAFRIEEATGQAVAYTYFRRDENEARQANVLTRDEARRIAANIAKLPELPGGSPARRHAFSACLTKQKTPAPGARVFCSR